MVLVTQPLIIQTFFLVTILAALCWWRESDFGINLSRDLSTWSNYTSCEQCNQDSNWNFLNSVWDNYDANSVSRLNYNSSTGYQYWHNAKSTNDYIYMSKSGYSVDLYAYSNTSASFNPLWEWRVLFLLDYDIHIDIERDTSHYEDFYAYTNTDETNNYLYSKYFASWNESQYRLTLSNTGYISFKALKLNDLSNYKVRMSQPYNRDHTVTIIILCVGSVIFISSLVLLGLTIWWAVKTVRRIQSQRYVFIPPDNNKKQYIEKCLKNMSQNKYSVTDVKFEQTSCVIWLEDFWAESEVYITNECSHIFHTSWLKEWFHNISKTKDLKCPLWSTIITDKSKRQTLIIEDVEEEPADSNENAVQNNVPESQRGGQHNTSRVNIFNPVDNAYEGNPTEQPQINNENAEEP